MKSAVITADIINSSAMSFQQREGLLESIRQRLTLIGQSTLQMQSELYRGDSFQCQLRKPEWGIRTALILKTYIKSLDPIEIRSVHPHANQASAESAFTDKMFDVRMSLGIGEVLYDVSELGLSDGEAFHLSGRKLDDMKKQKLSFAITTEDKYKEEWAAMSVLIDYILSKTTALQCEVIALKLEGTTETEIAERLSIQQSAVNQRSGAAGWNAIETAVKRFENVYING